MLNIWKLMINQSKPNPNNWVYIIFIRKYTGMKIHISISYKNAINKLLRSRIKGK